MSVLINGMEMPINRGEYDLRLYVDPDGTATVEGAYCRFEGEPFEAVPVPEHGDLIDRNETIKSLWKALYEYEDRTEKQFVESSELDVADWILHRIFVQNMSDIDRQTILQMPTIIPAEEGDYS